MENIILIIDDCKEVRENTEEILRLSGYKVHTATNGKEGLELMHKCKPNLILCDVLMPQLDGYGVLRALENIPGLMGIPFVFMSAKTDVTDFRKGIDLGADGYLPKPFGGDELLSTISSKLKKHALLKKTFQYNLDNYRVFSKPDFHKDIDKLSSGRNIKKVRKKDVIFIEGDCSSYIYFVVSGKIKVFKTNELGKEYIINIFKSGDFMGYHALTEDNIHRESAMAIENAEIILIPKQDFLQLLYSNNEIALKFIYMLSSSFIEAEERLLNLAYNSARKRVAEAIIFVSRKYQPERSAELTFELNRENISALSGISPESVSRNLSDFKEEGLIETMNGCIKIKDFKKLEMMKN